MVLWPTLLYIVYGVCVYIYYYSSVFGFKRRTQSPFYLTNQLWGLTVLFVPILKLSFLSELEGERSDRLFGKRPSDNVSSFVFDYNDDIVVVLVFLGSLDKKKKKKEMKWGSFLVTVHLFWVFAAAKGWPPLLLAPTTTQQSLTQWPKFQIK